MLEITHRLFDAQGEALELLSRSRDLRSGNLKIIADAAHHLLKPLGRFREAYPGIEISIRTGNSKDVVSALETYQADIGVLGEIPDPVRFKAIKLSSAPLIAFTATGPEKKSAPPSSISLAKLLDQPLVLRERGSKTRQKLEGAAAALGLAVNVAIEAEGREAVQQIVAAGAGFGVVSAAEFDHPAGLTAVQISDCDITMDEALICLTERAGGKLIRTFCDFAN